MQLFSLNFFTNHQSGSLMINQDGVFWTKLQGCGILICMRMDQSGCRGGDICLYGSALAQRALFPFPPKTAFCWLKRKHQRCLMGAEWRWAAQARADQQGAEQNCLAGEGPGPGSPHSCAIITAVLNHNGAIWHWIKFPSLPHPKVGIPVGLEMVPTTVGWQYEFNSW